MSLSALRFPAKSVPATAAVIFLHGLGDTGAGWSFMAEEAARTKLFEHVNFVFPNAPVKPVSLNMGMPMPSWYDIYSLDKLGQVDEKGILESVGVVEQFIKEQTDQGISPDRIVVGGFSQGAAVSLSTSMVTKIKLGGIVALSGYLPLKDKFAAETNDTNKETPYFMGHGTDDQVVKFQYGDSSSKALQEEFGRQVEFHSYPGMPHSACPEELAHLFKFLGNTIPKQ